MNVKKISSFILLFALSFSLVHDYIFVTLEKDHHSAVEYIFDEFYTSDSNKDGLMHDIHTQYHAMDISPAKPHSILNTIKTKSIFKHNKVVLSYQSFNFLKPPIA